MSNTPESLYDALQDGIEIGPEHHRFKLIKHTGIHALGRLWQAEDISVQGSPLVTLLIINPFLLKQANFVEGIKKHAALNKQLKNKHIAECYGFFTHKSKLLFLSYEKLDGLTLGGLIRKGGKLAEKQQLGLIRQLAYAIDMGYQKLHSAHGCLDSDFIFINRNGGIKLTLFSLRESLESLSALLPEPFRYKQYQAPEGFHPGKLTRQADVYSFACILYELFTGKSGFTPEDTEAQRVRTPLAQPKNLSDTQWESLQKALSTTPEERFNSCTEMVEALFPPQSEEAQTTEPEQPVPEDVAEDTQEIPAEESIPSKKRLPKLSLSKPVMMSLVGCLLFAIGYLIGWFTSEFINFKERDFQALQIQKQNEALQQMYSSLQAQQELHNKQDQQLKDNQLEITVLQQKLEKARAKLQNQDPEKPGNQIFKDQISDQTYGPEMVVLPSGQFRMGDQAGLGDDNEKPVHVVHIAKPFAIARFEVTFKEYDEFADATSRPLPSDEGWGRGQRPVINVSWKDAAAYATWLKNKTGLPYRLPSEAEWEYAARAGSLSTFWWGDEFKENMANCAGCGSEWDGKQTAPVGSFSPNNWGLHDMTGNVDEWVADCYLENYTQAPIDGSAYKQRGCADRVMRGGSWFEIERLIRPASRYRNPLNAKRDSWGFRVALDLE